MMRMKFELPHGFNSCPRIPGCHAFAVWPAFVDSGDRGVKSLVPLWLAQEHMSTWQVGVVAHPILPATLSVHC